MEELSFLEYYKIFVNQEEQTSRQYTEMFKLT